MILLSLPKQMIYDFQQIKLGRILCFVHSFPYLEICNHDQVLQMLPAIVNSSIWRQILYFVMKLTPSSTPLL